MSDIDEKILSLMDKMHTEDPLRGIDTQKHKLLQELKSKKGYELRQGHIVDARTKKKVDLEGDVKLIVDSSYSVRRRTNAAAEAAYVSPWSPPSSETKQRSSAEMKKVLQKLLKIHSIKANDDQAMDRALDLISQNFLFEIDANGEPTFAKLNASGLVGKERYSFLPLIPQELIDQQSTSFAKELRTSELRQLAMKLIPTPNPRPSEIEEKLALIQKQEFRTELPLKKLPHIPPGEIEREFARREAAIMGVDPGSGGHAGGLIRNAVRWEVEKLDDVTEIFNQLKSIKPAIHSQWEGMPTQSTNPTTNGSN